MIQPNPARRENAIPTIDHSSPRHHQNGPSDMRYGTQPSSPRTRFVTLAFGPDQGHAIRCNYAVLAMMAQAPAGSEFLIITDDSAPYRWLATRARIVTFDAATRQRWRGPQDFMWRIKIEALRLAAEGSDANLVYFDTDVLARKPFADLLVSLSDGMSIMHVPEYDLATNRRRGNRRLWQQIQHWSETTGLPLGPSVMWNAGVIGIGRGSVGLLDQVLATCDSFTANGVAHALTEQFSFSRVLSTSSRLVPAAPWMDHFWGNKDAYDRDIHAQLAWFHACAMSPTDAIDYVHDHPIVHPLRVRKPWFNSIVKHLLPREVPQLHMS